MNRMIFFLECFHEVNLGCLQSLMSQRSHDVIINANNQVYLKRPKPLYDRVLAVFYFLQKLWKEGLTLFLVWVPGTVD